MLYYVVQYAYNNASKIVEDVKLLRTLQLYYNTNHEYK